MKIVEITQSGGIKDLGQDFEVVAQMIFRDCKQYLASVRQAGGYLYRGEGGIRPRMFLGSSRQNRPPLHSDATAQQYFDMCLKKLGFTALRSNSIFATSDHEHSTRFGRPYVIFPIDGRSAYTYTDYYDLTLGNHHITHMVNHKKLTPVVDELVDRLRPLSNINSPTVMHIFDAMNSLTDRVSVLNILTRLKDRFIASGAEPQWFDINLAEFLDAKEFDNSYNPAKTDLSDAIKGQKEVYITGEYYAVMWSYYSQELRRFMP